MNINHKLAALVACVAAACLVAACGSATSSSSGSSSKAAASSRTGSAARSQLVACLKQHGVTLPSRAGGFRRPGSSTNGGGAPPPGGSNGSGAPPPGGGGFFGGGSHGGFGGGFRRNPKLQAAFKACGAKFGGRRQFKFNPAQRKTEINNFVKCVRQHGYNLPKPNLSGTGAVFPRSIESNKKFQAAERSCASELVPRGAPPSGGQTTTASSTA